jgi:hypothetical protein
MTARRRAAWLLLTVISRFLCVSCIIGLLLLGLAVSWVHAFFATPDLTVC